ncbi:putative ankyrin domain protein [Eutypa lata UCREL1]|uniref:Putative ankyrin domain protein n=1 Tax=Eutypa lata (strain UCR-EL1) TaxID=1287681 RepID=M7SGL1_EUTLA|nr:putative ankyrin domain protein [Eutypa lata UCREL1]
MRDRTKEVERLKRQLQQLQGALGHNGSTTPPPEQDSPNHAGAVTPPSSSHRMGEYVHQPWPHSSGPEHVNGLGLTTDGETPLSFDTSSFFPQLQSSGEMMTGIATPPSSTNGGGRRSRAVTSSSVTSNGLPSNHHLRSSSTGPLMMAAASTCSSPIPHHHQWHQPTSADRRESLQVGPMSTSPSPMLPVTRETYSSLCSSPEEVSFMQHSKPAYATATSMDEGMASTGPVYPPPPDHHHHGRATTGWSTPVDGAGGHSPLASAGGYHLSTVSELPEVAKPLPETTAPLLHFAIASGHTETLRLLLARPDINLNGRDNSGYTPLQRAVSNGRTDMAAMLLERGAVVDGVEEWMQQESKTGILAESSRL